MKLKNKSKELIDTKIAAIFMKKSNLSQEILKTIWSISSNSKDGLHEEEFYIALRLIALAQNNFPFTEKEIEINSPIPPLPKFEIISQKPSNCFNDEDDGQVYQIPQSNLKLYKQLFENNKDSQLYYISTKKAIEVWERNDNKNFNIDKVANSLKPLEKKGYLNLKEFQVACHLLSICNCYEIPNPLPNCLLKFLGRPLIANRPRNEFSKINSNEIHSNSNIRMQRTNKNIQKFNSDEIQQESNEDIKEFMKDNRKNYEIKDDKNMENSQKNIGYKEDNNDFNKGKMNNENSSSSDKNNNIHNFEEDNFKNSDNNHEMTNNDNLSEIMKRIENLEKNNEININLKNNNEALLKKIDELEKKNEQANLKISSLASEVDYLKKEKSKMSEEMNQLKQMFLSMKTLVDSFNVNKMNNPFKVERKENQNERFKTLNSPEHSAKELKKKELIINEEYNNNPFPRNTLENNNNNYLNSKGIIFNNKKITLDKNKRNNPKK